MKNILKFAAFLLLFVFAFSLCSCGENSPQNSSLQEEKFEYYPMKENIKTDGQFTKKEGVEFTSSLWQTPSSERYEAADHDGVSGYFIDSVNGTKVFCYVGIPQNADAEKKVPAVVLVHGATGTAFYDWVQMWTQKGYAAIAMDTEGQMPTATSTTMTPSCMASVRPHGPLNTSFYDSASPIKEQWTYHAVAAVIASTSFIGSFDCVDETKIGITGVSYGGYLTCLAAAYDDRYSFAAPVYGCLGNACNTSFEFGKYLTEHGDGSAATVWDDETVLSGNRTPFLFVSGLPDPFFGSDAVTRTAKQCLYAQTVFKPNLTHGHIQGADIEEIFLFANEIFYKNDALVKVNGNSSEGLLTLEIPKGIEIKKAEAYYTVSDKISPETEWISVAAEIVGNNVIFDVDQSVPHYWVRVTDSRGLYSSGFVS